MQYADIPKYTRSGSYEVTVSLTYLKDHMDLQNRSSRGPLDLNPDFQRAHVWTKKQQIHFVEHLLRGGRSGLIIYTNCVGWNKDYEGPYVVVDGKQRLTACLRFVENKLPVFGENLYRDFEDRIPFFVGLLWHVNDLKTRAEVLRWYLDLNTGGTIHTKKELDKVRALLAKEVNK